VPCAAGYAAAEDADVAALVAAEAIPGAFVTANVAMDGARLPAADSMPAAGDAKAALVPADDAVLAVELAPVLANVPARAGAGFACLGGLWNAGVRGQRSECGGAGQRECDHGVMPEAHGAFPPTGKNTMIGGKLRPRKPGALLVNGFSRISVIPDTVGGGFETRPYRGFGGAAIPGCEIFPVAWMRQA